MNVGGTLDIQWDYARACCCFSVMFFPRLRQVTPRLIHYHRLICRTGMIMIIILIIIMLTSVWCVGGHLEVSFYFILHIFATQMKCALTLLWSNPSPESKATPSITACGIIVTVIVERSWS